jgi:hypothetical protein
MRKSLLLILGALVGLTVFAQTVADGPQFSADGQLTLPKEYRQWTYLSSGLGMTYGPAAQADAANPKFDNVFVNPVAYKAFMETGRWPDKTMFVLEVRSAASHGSINNGGHYQGELLGIDVELKDQKRFPQKWAFFAFETQNKTAALPGNSACNNCHSQSGAVDNTFVQFYPTLFEVAQKKGTLSSAFLANSPAK